MVLCVSGADEANQVSVWRSFKRWQGNRQFAGEICVAANYTSEAMFLPLLKPDLVFDVVSFEIEMMRNRAETLEPYCDWLKLQESPDCDMRAWILENRA